MWTNLWIVAVSSLVVKHIEKWFGPSILVEVVGGRCLRLAEHITGVYQWCNVLCVTECRNRRVPGVYWMQNSPLPVRVLVNDGKEYLGQMIAVCISNIRAQDLVSTLTFEASLERKSIIYILWKWIEREDQNDIEWKRISERERERESERDKERF